MSILIRILGVVFGKPEELDGHGRVDAYMFRWTLLVTRWGKLYLHRFVDDDWSLDLHDHPKRFTSIGLWGCYDEWTPWLEHANRRRRYQAPWFRSFPAEHKHRVTLPDGECWTLVWVGPKERDWGFWYNGAWIEFRDYIFGYASSLADSRTRPERPAR